VPNAPNHLLHAHAAYLLIAAACVPYLIDVRRRQAEEARTLLLEWAASLTIPIGLALLVFDALGSQREACALLLFSSIFAAMYAWGSREEGEVPSFTSPLSSVGLFGLVSIALALSFEDAWPWPTFASMTDAYSGTPAILTALAALLLALHPLWRAIEDARAGRWDSALACGFPLWVLVGSTLMPAGLAMVFGNLYALALGMGFLLSGLQAMNLRRANVGLLVLAILFMLRFVDSDLSLLARGIGMMVIGVGFAGVNVALVQRQRVSELADEGGSR
jgi:hypothetical protein